jgi:hypothetical protein
MQKPSLATLSIDITVDNEFILALSNISKENKLHL